MHGTVTRYFKKHGKNSYGFIKGHDGEFYYFNFLSLKSEIQEGEKVNFNGEKNGKGLFATEVKSCAI